MSDLSATNCGCDNGYGYANAGGLSSYVWVLLILACCGVGGNGLNTANAGGGDNVLWIILLLLLCGNGCGNGCGC